MKIKLISTETVSRYVEVPDDMANHESIVEELENRELDDDRFGKDAELGFEFVVEEMGDKKGFPTDQVEFNLTRFIRRYYPDPE